jgi:hypothetical protein
MADALSGAFYRAARDGRNVVGVQYVLDSLAQRSAALTAQFGRILRQEIRSRRGVGQSSVEGDDQPASFDYCCEKGDLEVAGTLREAAWRGYKGNRRAMWSRLPQWSTGVCLSTRQAFLDAQAVGLGHAQWGHLLVALLAGPDDTARELLDRLGVRTNAVRLPEEVDVRIEGAPFAPAVDALWFLGALTIPSAALRVPLSLLRAAALLGSRTSPVVAVLEQEAIRQAARLGAGRLGQAHLILAMCSVDEQLRATNRRLAPRYASYHSGGRILFKWGVTYGAAARSLSRLPELVGPIDRTKRWRSQRGDPVFGLDAAQVIGDATALSMRLGHRHAGTLHILASLLADKTGSGRTVVGSLGVDVAGLARDTDAALRTVDP